MIKLASRPEPICCLIHRLCYTFVIQHPEHTGLYHLTARGEISWHHYAQFVVDYAQRIGIMLKADAEKIAPVPSSAFQTKAVRPQNSKLDTTKLQSVFNRPCQTDS